MIYLISAHRVADKAKWMAAFETPQGEAMRQSFGMKHYEAFSVAEDPNCIVVLSGFDNQEAADKFVASDELKAAMEMSGVIEMLSTIDCSKALVEIEEGPK